jgi:type II secretory pathway component GspD/PulD (secretin)
MGQDGKTIIIGGLLKDVYYEQERGVPILKDIPLLGALFRSTVRQKEKIELAIMITPTIVDPNQTSGIPSQYRVELNSDDPAVDRTESE